MKLEEVTIHKHNLKTFKIINLDAQTTPLSAQEIQEAFNQVALSFEKVGEAQIKLNSAHEMLNNENGECVLNDYIALFENGPIVNLGCCFFNFEDIQDLNENQVLEIVKNLCLEAFKAQPLIMQRYAKRCYEKIQDVKNG